MPFIAHVSKADRPYLRQVLVDDFALRTWPTTRRAPTGQQLLGYELVRPNGVVLFTGEDYGCSPQHAPDSDDALRDLLGLLTVQPGDTDTEWFDDYTPEQMRFARSGEAEALKWWTDDDCTQPFVDLDNAL